MNVFFDVDRIAKVFCSSDEHSCVRLAVRDFLSDLTKASGRGVEPCPSAAEADIIIGTVGVSALPVDASMIRGKEEHYAIIPCEHGMVIAGSDRRGTMWGVYECLRRFLKVDPLYLWTQHEPARRDSVPMPDKPVIGGPHGYRFRGWFINDEDLIEGFCKRGKPEKGYRFQRDYAEMLDMIIETALRLKQNMLIPCSHLDIMRSEDEMIVRRVTERGLYISMHHQEPVGVHQFTMDRYWKERGVDGNVNFVDDAELYKTVWLEYIRRWARYDGVIWQLGLRGRGDRPVWYQNDRVPETPEARGRLISDAIQTQMDLIKAECRGQEILSTATLWMEGMPLYKAGALTFPKGTMVIQSDFGPDQMWGTGYDETPRLEGTDYGVYYHLAFWGCGPHLAQGNRPEKIQYNYRQARAKGDTAYAVLNVSNFREFVYGIRYEAKITWDLDDDDVSDDRADWCREQFEVEDTSALEKVYKEYFDCFTVMDGEGYQARMTLNDGMLKRVAAMLIKIINGGELAKQDIQNKRLFAFDNTDDFIAYYAKATEVGIERFNRVHALAREAMNDIPDHRRAFYQANISVQIEIMLALYGWVNALCRAAHGSRAGFDESAYNTAVETAASYIEQALVDRKKALYGRFIGWYNGDRLMDFDSLLHMTLELKRQPPTI